MTMMASKCPNLIFKVVDINEERISSWNNKNLSKLPIFEPGLKELIAKTRNKNLFFSTNIKESIESADIIFISVKTPTKTKGLGAGKSSDLKWVEASAREVARYAKGHTIVVDEHNIDLIKCADNVIDLGPEGGDNGGYIVAQVTPEDISKDKKD